MPSAAIILTAETSLQSAQAVAQAVPQEEVEEEVHVVDQPEPPIAQQPAEQIGTQLIAGEPNSGAVGQPQMKTPEQLLQALRKQQEDELNGSQPH